MKTLARQTLATLALLTAVAGGSLVGGCSSSGHRPLHAMEHDGDVRYDVHNYAEAADHYQQYVDVMPNNAEIRYKLGRCYLETGDYRQAKHNLQVAYDLKPDTEEYIDAYAEALMRAGENEQLAAFLTKVVNERGRASDYLRLGEYGRKIGNADDAASALITAAKLDGGVTPKYQLALAAFYKQVGDRAHEVERLRMAYYLVPNNEYVKTRGAELGEIMGPTWALRPLEQDLGQSAADTGAPAGTAK